MKILTDLQKLLSSVSPEELDRLKDVASSLISDASKSEKKEETPQNNAFAAESLMPVMNAISKMTEDDDRIKLILHLKPLLSDERQRRADDAVKFLHIMQILPEIRGLL